MLVTSKNLQQFVTHLTNSLFSNLFFFHLRINRDIPLERKLSTRLGTDEKGRVYIPRFFFFFQHFVVVVRVSVGPVHYSWDPQSSFFNKIFIKNGSYGTIHIFKNYFATTFLVSIFSKISGIQTDSKVSIASSNFINLKQYNYNPS